MNRSGIIIGIIICLFVAGAAHAGEPGSSGFVFLRLGNGARAAGMGDAFTAVSDDATGIYYNPAGLADISEVDLNASHSEWLVDTRFEQASLAFELFSGTVGCHFTGIYYGELERRRNYPTILPDGTFTPYSLAASVGYGMDILPDLSVGIATKLIYEKIDFESATGFSLDIGAKHRSRIRGLAFGASILNIGPRAKFVEEEFYPPLQIRLGAAYTASEDWLYGDLILSGDFLIQNDSDEKFLFGMEYTYRDILSVRGGYKAGYDTQGPAMGIGITYNRMRFDYAYMPMEYDLGNSHRFSINVFPSSL